MDKEEKLQSATAITTKEYNKLKEKADAFDFLFSEDGIKTGNAMKLWMWRNKLEAIKKLVEEGPHPVENTLEAWQQAVDDWLGKLMNILEAVGR